VINFMLPDTAEVDFVANKPGYTSLRGHRQLRMDHGFMQLLKYSV
jgi:hypothetical protein